MRRLFISDLHLGDHRPDLTKLFHDFMKHFVKPEDNLYILGDMFEAWIGDDYVSATTDKVRQLLSEFTSSGGTGFIMHGNRDFLIGSAFCKQTGFNLIHEPYNINLTNRPCVLLHGDSLCTDDVEYQQFKQVVRSKDWQSEFLSKSLEERLAVAQGLRDKSKDSMSDKSEEIMDVTPTTVMDLFNTSNSDIVIHGHTHRQYHHFYETEAGRKERIVLGDWNETLSVLVEENNQLALRNYSIDDLSA